MDVKEHLPLAEWQRLERVEKNADRAQRLRIIILGIEGWTAPAVAMAVGLTRRICQRWVRRSNEDGLSGLDDRRGRQPRLPLTPEQQEQVRRRLDAGPTAQDEVCSLRGKDVPRILAQEFHLLRSLAGVYHLLHRLGYSYLRPRPRHRRADPEKQAAFLDGGPDRRRAIAAAYLNSHSWSHRAYDDYDALEPAAVDAWRQAALDVDLMKSVCAAPESATSN